MTTEPVTTAGAFYRIRDPGEMGREPGVEIQLRSERRNFLAAECDAVIACRMSERR